MLNALKLLFQNHEMRFPYIKGMRHRIRTYKIQDRPDPGYRGGYDGLCLFDAVPAQHAPIAG